MRYEELKENLNVIKEYISTIKALRDDNEVQNMRTQLRAIERTIRQLERNGVTVPEGISADKLALESKIRDIKRGPEEISLLYEDLLDIVIKMGRILRKRPDRDLRHMLNKERAMATPSHLLRKSILSVLAEMGGSGHEKEVLRAIEDKMKEQFSASDYERPYGSSPRWKINVRLERNLMIREGLLTADSKRKKWTLSR